MRFVYMANFGYQELPLKKIADNWIKRSKELRTDNVNRYKQNARIGLLGSLKKYAKPKDVQILTNEYVDDLGRTRKRAAGLMETNVLPRQQGIYVDTLIANPKGDIDKTFGNATDAMIRKLKSTYPDYGMKMYTPNKDVSDMYARKLNIPADLRDGGYSHVGMISDIPYGG